jgi:3-methyladenine DNA glycosylase AlkD
MLSNWAEETYQIFLNHLDTIKEPKYKDFHEGLVLNSKYQMLGIRLPIMRKIAKEITKTNITDFLDISKDNYYEEVMIQGLVISAIKDEEVFYKYHLNHIKKIDNWALCDTYCNSIKIIRKHENKYFKEALKMSLNKDEFISRTGLIMILSHFIKQNNLSKIFETLNKIKSDKYYINMAQAWLLCELFIKYKNETLKYLETHTLNKFTINKTISKIHDSYRVSKEDKIYINKYKVR